MHTIKDILKLAGTVIAVLTAGILTFFVVLSLIAGVMLALFSPIIAIVALIMYML